MKKRRVLRCAVVHVEGDQVMARQTTPLLVVYMLVGAAAFGAIGGVIGLVIGLRAYVPTALVAAVEVGAPSALLGGLVGLVVGSIVSAVKALRCRRSR